MEQIRAGWTENTQPKIMPQGMYIDILEFPDGCVFPDGCRFEYVQANRKKWSRFGDYCKFGNATIFGIPVRLGWGVQLGNDCMCMADMQFGKYAVIGERFRANTPEEQKKLVTVELGAYSRLGKRFVMKGDVEFVANCTIGAEGTFYCSVEIGKYCTVGESCRFRGRAIFAQPTYFDGVCKFGDVEEAETIGALSMDLPTADGKRSIMTVYCQEDKTLTEVCMSGGRLDKNCVAKAVKIAKIIFNG